MLIRFELTFSLDGLSFPYVFARGIVFVLIRFELSFSLDGLSVPSVFLRVELCLCSSGSS